MSTVPGCGHHSVAFGCQSCFDLLKQGLAAAHENYKERGHTITQLRERIRLQRVGLEALRKAKALYHRGRAQCNRENHRLLQNAHRKTLRKLERAEGMSRMERSARAADLAYLKRMGEAVKSMGLTDAVNEVRRVLWLTGEFGLSKEAREGRIALDVIVARLTETAASSGPAPARRFPSLGSGPLDSPHHEGEEPWEPDP